MATRVPHTKEGIPRARPGVQQDANYLRAQIEQTNWEIAEPVMLWGQWKIFLFGPMSKGTAYSDQRKCYIMVGPETWNTLRCNNDAVVTFLNSMAGGASGMKYIAMDAGPYEVAARLEAQRDGGDKVAVKDLLDTIIEGADRLLTQAAGLNEHPGGPSLGQQQLFAGQLAEVQRQLIQAEEKLAKARSAVDLAAMAVAGATS